MGELKIECLLPELNFSITVQREILAKRCKTNPMQANRGIVEYCQTQYGEVLNNPQIFTRSKLNPPGKKCDIDKMHNGVTSEIKKSPKGLDRKHCQN